MSEEDRSLPKGWHSVHIAHNLKKQRIYFNIRAMLAQETHPRVQIHNGQHDEPAVQRAIKRAMKGTIHIPINPRPALLLDNWTCVLSLPKNFKPSQDTATGAKEGLQINIMYISNTGVMQITDPTPPRHMRKSLDFLADLSTENGETPIDTDNDLPGGWEIDVDEDGDEYFVNRNTMVASYDDPRVLPHPTPSRFLMLINSVETKAPKWKGNANKRRASKSAKQWILSPRSKGLFTETDYYLGTVLHKQA